MRLINTLILLCFSIPALHATATVENFMPDQFMTPHHLPSSYNPEAIIESAFKRKIQNDYIKDSRVTNQRFFKYGNFILSRQTDEHIETDDEQNHPQMKEQCRTTVVNGLIYDAQGRLADNDNTITDEFEDAVDFNYVISKKGELFLMSANDGCHSYILKSKEEKPYYGIGKPVACAGKISARKGKIISFDIDSGHYWPIEDQLIIATHHLAAQGVFADDAVIGYHDYRKFPENFIRNNPSVEWSYKISLEAFSALSPAEILNRY